MFISNITQARVRARWFFLNVDARKYLRAGPTKVYLPDPFRKSFDATVKPDGKIPNIAVHCPPLFNTTIQFLPLRNGDVVVFNIHNGEVSIIDIVRGGTGMLTSKPTAVPTPLQDDEEPEEGPEAAEDRNPPPLPQQRLPGRPPTGDSRPPEDIPDDCLSLQPFQPLPDYLRSNRHRILALGEQVLPPWSTGYDAFQEPVMERLRYAFPTRRISRAEVVVLFESWHDPVLCLISAMVWGGIRCDHLSLLLGMGEPGLRSRMEALRPLVRSGALEMAYGACSTGAPLKFEGVGPAFFTKLFYFIGQAPPTLNPAPLILDKWTSNAFRSLGRQVCPSAKWERWFDASPLNDGKPAAWRQPYPNADIYRLYVAWFNHWAQLLGTSASRLEQFVFGWDRRNGGNQWWNPRNQLIELGH